MEKDLSIVQESFIHGGSVAVCLKIAEYCNTHSLRINTISVDSLYGYISTEKWNDSIRISPPQRHRLGIFMNDKYYMTVPLHSDITISFSTDSHQIGVRKYNSVPPVVVKCNENGAVQVD